MFAVLTAISASIISQQDTNNKGMGFIVKVRGQYRLKKRCLLFNSKRIYFPKQYQLFATVKLKLKASHELRVLENEMSGKAFGTESPA
jgi:hypothetical protein